jgi:predicted GTPase
MRIPIQICTVENRNIIPLRDGTIMDNLEGYKGSIEERSIQLKFGVAEKLLMQDRSKKTIVISIMGAQSTGKSYLLNRVF